MKGAMIRIGLGLAVIASGLWNDVLAQGSVRGFSGAEKAATGAIASAAILSSLALQGPEEEARWSSELPGDGAVSAWLGARTAVGSFRFQKWSDLSLAAAVIFPIAFTGSDEDASRWQAIQSYAITGLMTGSLKALAGRQRPYGSQCRDNSLGQDCFSSYRNESFPSGHSAFAFTGAGLLCSMRGDALCPIGIGIAMITGSLRIAGNQHYLSDVLAGAMIGWVSGYFLPQWRGSASPAAAGAAPGAVGVRFAVFSF